MKRSTIMLAGAGALVVGGVGFVMWRRRKEAEHQSIIDTVRSRGKDQTMAPTNGQKLVAIAGGTGAGAGRPLDTSTPIRLVGAHIPTDAKVSKRGTITVRDHRG